MRRILVLLISFVLVLTMIAGALVSCAPYENDTPDTDEQSDQISEESSTVDVKKDPVEPSEHIDLIQAANGLANGVQAYFPDASRTHFTIQNLEMILNYARSNRTDQLVESIKNRKGNAYISNTMDVFVRMANGDSYDTFYASQSTYSAEANLYRFGYYYYQGMFEFQNFVPKESGMLNSTNINIKKQFTDGFDVTRGKDSGNISYVIASGASDPRVQFETDFSYAAEDYNTLMIRVKAIGDTNSIQFFIKTDDNVYNELSSVKMSLINDGEYHDYYISLYNIPGFEGTLKGIRFDPNGSLGSGFAIESMVLGKTDLDVVPSALSINRHFHVYSDKMHHSVQFAVTERTENIVEVGMLTEIAVDSVSKIIIVTEDNKNYDSLDAISEWESVVAVGFDVTNAGIFGFILPKDDAAGKIKVEIKDGVYVIEQTRTPVVDGVSGVIIPSIDTEARDEDGNYKNTAGISNNGNDFYIAQRVYTDENHDFSEFLQETYFERNPLDSKRISVSEADSDGGAFLGYDAIRGIYAFSIDAPKGGFMPSFNNPNRDYKVNFTIRSDIDRSIYVMTTTSGSTLECATLMDGDMMLLPVPIEVIKNFSEPTGERNLFNISDPTFSEAIFYLPLDANEKQEYTIINLYQNWGNYPLKQLSQIPFHCPYYHLSTGTTETNCILPWFTTSSLGKGDTNTLPDFRSMSAPYWLAQPQHNSSGFHTWLRYTNSEGKSFQTESVNNYITSYGPTYAELVWENLSDDGKIKVTYTHMEMPQVDENRSYYTMEYEFLEDLTINNFKDNFRFYDVTDNDTKGSYRKLGYLNEANECVVVDANQDANVAPEYVLGDNCPYFSLFMMPDWDRESDTAEGYANLAFLIYTSEFIIGGSRRDYSFLIRNAQNHVTLTLNESGTVEFKAGDKITINAIVLPWGSQEYEDGIIDLEASPANYEYDMLLPDGTLYMDKNVRDVRENTLLNPLTAISDTDTVLDSTFLPKVRSKDGKSAEFTLSGGENNVAVRVYGFDKLTAPKVEEYVNGEWVEYVLSSHEKPDKAGNYHYYDGYQVYYDEDGTYSYSFVTTMYDGAPRRFRISASDDFNKWPAEPSLPENTDFLSVYVDAEELIGLINDTPNMYGDPVINESDEDGVYAGVYVKLNNVADESYSTLLSSNDEVVTGQYLVIKYRVPETNTESVGFFQIWASTITTRAEDADSFIHYPVADGEWHVDVIDLTKTALTTFDPDAEGRYCAKLLRFDIFNKIFENADTHIDIAYIGMDYDILNVCELEKENFKTVSLYENGSVTKIDTETGKSDAKSYIDPSSGYKESNVAFGCVLDSVSGVPADIASNTVNDGIVTKSDATVDSDGSLVLYGWCVANGGIDKYVYSIDGGKTWLECEASLTEANDAIIDAARWGAGGGDYYFDDVESSKVNGSFQTGVGINIDLSSVEGETVDVILAAIPKTDTSSLILLFSFENIDLAK